MDYEELSNYTYDDTPPGQSAGEIAHDVIFVIFCILGICADAAITYTIVRFKRMRTIPNILLLNWAIADMCYLLVAPSGYELISVLDHTSISHEFFCALHHFGSVFHLTVAIFAIIASVDWFIAAYFPKTSETVRKYHRYILGSLWIISLLTCGITTGLCFNHIHVYLVIFFLLASFCVLIIVIVIFQFWRAISKYHFRRPNDYPSLLLTLSTAYLACNLLGLLTLCIAGFIIYHPLIVFIAQCSIFSSAIVNFNILYFTDKDFQACILQIVKRSGSGYEESITDFINPVYKKTIVKDKSSVKISFDNQDELLITNEY